MEKIKKEGDWFTSVDRNQTTSSGSSKSYEDPATTGWRGVVGGETSQGSTHSIPGRVFDVSLSRKASARASGSYSSNRWNAFVGNGHQNFRGRHTIFESFLAGTFRVTIFRSSDFPHSCPARARTLHVSGYTRIFGVCMIFSWDAKVGEVVSNIWRDFAQRYIKHDSKNECLLAMALRIFRWTRSCSHASECSTACRTPHGTRAHLRIA